MATKPPTPKKKSTSILSMLSAEVFEVLSPIPDIAYAKSKKKNEKVKPKKSSWW